MFYFMMPDVGASGREKSGPDLRSKKTELTLGSPIGFFRYISFHSSCVLILRIDVSSSAKVLGSRSERIAKLTLCVSSVRITIRSEARLVPRPFVIALF